MDFEKWLKEVDAVLEKIAGATYEDIPDQPWADWYEDGLSPSQAAHEALEDCGFYDLP